MNDITPFRKAGSYSLCREEQVEDFFVCGGGKKDIPVICRDGDTKPGGLRLAFILPFVLLTLLSPFKFDRSSRFASYTLPS